MPDPITPLATPSALWSRAKADYLDGVTAVEACRRYGLSRSRFFERAKAEGWRRADRLPQMEDEDEAAFDDAGPLPAARVLAEKALRRAERAVSRGRLPEALGWTRLARDLRRLSLDETGCDSWRQLVKNYPSPEAPPAPSPAAPENLPTKRHPITKADVPPEIWNDPDANAMIAWLGHARNWPELTAEASPEGRAKAARFLGESGSETSSETEASAEEPDFPDAEIESGPDGRPAPPPLTEDPEGWPAWAAFCETMRHEHPDQPCWGEAIDAGPPLSESG